MSGLVQALSRISVAKSESEILKAVALFCGAGLLLSLALAIYGFDPGFF